MLQRQQAVDRTKAWVFPGLDSFAPPRAIATSRKDVLTGPMAADDHP